MLLWREGCRKIVLALFPNSNLKKYLGGYNPDTDIKNIFGTVMSYPSSRVLYSHTYDFFPPNHLVYTITLCE